jgi:hypothetical protein
MTDPQKNDTEVGRLIQQIRNEAALRGMYIKRTYTAKRYGGTVEYELFRSDDRIHSIELQGLEGKTSRWSGYKTLVDLLALIQESTVLSDDDQPTIEIQGNYLLPESILSQIHSLGAKFNREAECWMATPANETQTRELVAPYAAYLSSIKNEYTFTKAGLPKSSYKLTRKGWVVWESERWKLAIVGIGANFSRQANDPLREMGAKWNGEEWTCYAGQAEKAKNIIADANKQEAQQKDAERARKAEAEKIEAKQKFEFSMGSGYNAEPRVGQIIEQRDGSIVVVEKVSSRYYREDGLSFGVGDDEGYVWTVTARLATESEISASDREKRTARVNSIKTSSTEAAAYIYSVAMSLEPEWRGYTHCESDGDWPQAGNFQFALIGVAGSEIWVAADGDGWIVLVRNTHDTVLSAYYRVAPTDLEFWNAAISHAH